MRMVLVGKTGVGKSATGNTICGAGKGAPIFQALARAISVTKKCKQHSFKRFGYDLQLVDVPGFCDTSRSHEDIQKEVMKCVCMSSPGIHAILFIVKIGRFTKEDGETLERFLQCFGEEAKRFVIVVFTGKDDLEEQDDTLDNYIGEFPVNLKTFLFDTRRRCISVNNRGTNEENDKFTKDLIDKIKNMVDQNGGHCYTNEMYEQCEADLRQAEKKENLDEKRLEEIQEQLKQETAALEEQLQRQHLKIQEMEEKQLEKEQSGREKEEQTQLKERRKAEELRLKEEEEKQCLAEEKRRQAEQKEAEQNMIKKLQRQCDLERKQMKEEYERRKEELEQEQARKQIREKVEKGDTSYFKRLWHRFKSIFKSE